jgi:membrane protease YdiL (CAAX protease family)
MQNQEVKRPIAVSLFWKILQPILLFLFFWASQGMTFLRLPRLFLSADVAGAHPWIGVYEGHVWELAFALAYMGIATRGNFSPWGLNLNNARLSWRILWRFCIVFLAIAIAWNVVPTLLNHQTALGVFGPPTLPNVLAWLIFEWIFVGIAEEIMFRGLIQTKLKETWSGIWRMGKLEIPHAGVVTTALFCLAHIDPFHPHIIWQQQLFAFGLGMYYSIVRHRTGSLLNPILAHNFGDGVIVSAAYLLYFALR